MKKYRKKEGLQDYCKSNIELEGTWVLSLLISETRKECLLSPLLSIIVPKVLARAIGQEKEIKCIHIGMGEVKLSVSR